MRRIVLLRLYLLLPSISLLSSKDRQLKIPFSCPSAPSQAATDISTKPFTSGYLTLTTSDSLTTDTGIRPRTPTIPTELHPAFDRHWLIQWEFLE